ncbi:uncharacterized protein LODBEIA_P55550 [Lodderomyces beijingensis]|uniref:WD40 repeat-like protein n=1 Tax=Lodderomyces beijingensis TaxID=1775926 RepID=A0ABP0ZVJ9_9ASCO
MSQSNSAPSLEAVASSEPHASHKSADSSASMPGFSVERDFEFKIKTIIGTSARNSQQLAVQDDLVAATASGGIVVSKIDTQHNSVLKQRFFCANVSYHNDESSSWSSTPRVSGADAYLKMYEKSCLGQFSSEDARDAFGYQISNNASEVYGNSFVSNEKDEFFLAGTGGSGTSTTATSSSSPSKLKDKVRSISCVAISPNKKLLAVGESGYQPRVLIFSLAPNSQDCPIMIIHEHSFGVHALSFSPDSRFLCSLGVVNDGCINVWKLGINSAALSASNRLSNIVHKMIWHQDLIITLGLRFIKIWNFDTSAVATTITANTAAANTATNTTAAGHRSIVLRGKNVHLGPLMNSNFVDASMLNEDEMLIVANYNQLLLLSLNFETPRITPLEPRISKVGAFAVDHDAGLIWLEDGDGDNNKVESLPVESLKTVELSQINVPSPTRSPIRAHSQLNEVFGGGGGGGGGGVACHDQSSDHAGGRSVVVKICVFTPTHLICLKNNDTICFYNKAKHEMDQVLTRAVISNIAGVKRTCTNEYLVFSNNGKIEQFSSDLTSSLKPLLDFKVPGTGIIQNTLTAVEKLAQDTYALGDKYGSVYVVQRTETNSPARYEIVYQVQAHVTAVNDVIFFYSQDQDFVCSISRDRMIQLFTREADQKWSLWQTLSTHNGNLLKALYQDDRLYVCSSDRSISVHTFSRDANSSLSLNRTKLISLRSTPTAMALFDSDLVVSTADKQILIFDIASFELKRSLKLINEKLNESLMVASFVKYRHLLIVWSNDKSIRSFNYVTGRPVGVTWGHSDSLLGLLLRVQEDDAEAEAQAELISISNDGCLFSWSIVESSAAAASASPESSSIERSSANSRQEENTLVLSHAKVTRKILPTVIASSSLSLSLSPSSSSSSSLQSPVRSSLKERLMQAAEKNSNSNSNSHACSASPPKLTAATQKRLEMKNAAITNNTTTIDSPPRSKRHSMSPTPNIAKSPSPIRAMLPVLDKSSHIAGISKLNTPLRSPSPSPRPKSVEPVAVVSKPPHMRPYVHLNNTTSRPASRNSNSPTRSKNVAAAGAAGAAATYFGTSMAHLVTLQSRLDLFSVDEKRAVLAKLDEIRSVLSDEESVLETYSDKLVALVERKLNLNGENE